MSLVMRRRSNGNPKLAVAYIRVSTEDQNLGPEAQRAAIERWALANRVEVVAWFEDRGVSGATPIADREGFVNAISALRDHNAGILVSAKRDRIARDVLIAAMAEAVLRSASATLRTADGASDADGPEGLLMKGIIDLFAQYERAIIRARTRAALGAKKARGERTGKAPYGFTISPNDGRTLVPDDREQTIIVKARDLRAAGLTLGAIAGALTAQGFLSRANTAYRPSQIFQILKAAS